MINKIIITIAQGGLIVQFLTLFVTSLSALAYRSSSLKDVPLRLMNRKNKHKLKLVQCPISFNYCDAFR